MDYPINFIKKHLSENIINKIKNTDLFILAWKFVNNYLLNQWISQKKFKPKSQSIGGKLGINLIGFMDAPLGIGAAARSSELALITAGLSFNVVNINLKRSMVIGNNSKHKVNKINGIASGINIIHINPPEYPYLWRHLGKSLLVGKYNVGVWYWELSNLPDDWLRGFQVLDEIWVATRFVKEAVQKKSPIPVMIIPPCVKVELDATLTRDDFKLPRDAFLFLCAYDAHSIYERKNPLGVIRAFKKAFKQNDTSVGLVVKINNSNFDFESIRQIKNELQGYRNCFLIEETFPLLKFYSLVNHINAFVSLHRSEGFGLILAEAMSLGKPVIATNWSGNTDFMTPQNSCAVDYKLIPVKQGLAPYQPGQFWADADIDSASFFMNKLTSDHVFYNRISMNARDSIVPNFSPEKIGNIMKKRLDEISGRL